MIKFLKVRDVASPERENGNSGFDFFVPKFNKSFKEACKIEADKNPKAGCYFKKDLEGKEYIGIPAHGRISIPSGIKAFVYLGMPLVSYGLQMDLVVDNKSGVATKKGLDVGATIIDVSYKGEIHLSLTNTSNDDIQIYEDDKIVQIIPRVYVSEEASVFESAELNPESGITEDAFYEGFKYTNRGAGWAGSTGTKAK